MKNKLSLIITLFVMVFAGCKENTITNPLQDFELQKPKNNHDPSVHTGTILLDRMFRDPYPVMNSFYIIKGQIHYQQSVRILDPIPPNPQYIVSLILSVASNFTDFCTVCEPQTISTSIGTISIKTNDLLYIPGERGYTFEKTFPIQGREDKMLLACKFFVTTDSVVLNTMRLSFGSSIIENIKKAAQEEN